MIYRKIKKEIDGEVLYTLMRYRLCRPYRDTDNILRFIQKAPITITPMQRDIDNFGKGSGIQELLEERGLFTEKEVQVIKSTLQTFENVEHLHRGIFRVKGTEHTFNIGYDLDKNKVFLFTSSEERGRKYSASSLPHAFDTLKDFVDKLPPQEEIIKPLETIGEGKFILLIILFFHLLFIYLILIQ